MQTSSLNDPLINLPNFINQSTTLKQNRYSSAGPIRGYYSAYGASCIQADVVTLFLGSIS
jgi:hypothetical protein